MCFKLQLLELVSVHSFGIHVAVGILSRRPFQLQTPKFHPFGYQILGVELTPIP